jgi:hypothetical protein
MLRRGFWGISGIGDSHFRTNLPLSNDKIILASLASGQRGQFVRVVQFRLSPARELQPLLHKRSCRGLCAADVPKTSEQSIGELCNASPLHGPEFDSEEVCIAKTQYGSSAKSNANDNNARSKNPQTRKPDAWRSRCRVFQKSARSSCTECPSPKAHGGTLTPRCSHVT